MEERSKLQKAVLISMAAMVVLDRMHDRAELRPWWCCLES